jgi:hypothetical protein
LSENKKHLGTTVSDAADTLTEYIGKLQEQSYEDIISSYKSLQTFENLMLAFNETISEYNYDANQLSSSQKLNLSTLDKLSRLPGFPGVAEKEQYELEGILKQLEELSSKKMEDRAIINILHKARKRIERQPHGKIKRFEDHLLAFLYKKYDGKSSNQKQIANDFMVSLNSQIAKLKLHFDHKRYDGASRNRYFELLAFKAKLVQPKINIEINTLLCKVKSYFLLGKTQREIITFPGFSWDKNRKGKPLKLTALAFYGKQLYICIASSNKAFIIDDKNGKLRFVKTSGGQKRINSCPKTIEYVMGSFQEKAEKDVPLFLKLHFGKSYARRYLFNKQWGLFSEKPRIFLNNARLKREKINPGDPWKYYFDVSMSAKKVFGFKDFSNGILTNAQCVIGIDRGEVIPIAYTVLSIKKRGSRARISRDILYRNA